MSQDTNGRDIIVIGGSAGSMQPLRTLAASLPPDLPAAVFVVMHVSPGSPGLLPDILNYSGQIPAIHAHDGDPIRRGQIYVAPPDYHLLVKDGTMQVVRGPRENRFRPAIDPLFRSAAQIYGPRVAGVLLSGGLNDGTYGMMLVKAHGGLTVVQDPAEADVPDMVQSAIDHMDVDHILPVAQIAPLLNDLVRQPMAGPAVNAANPHSDPAEAKHTGLPHRPSGELAPIVCPECGGALWEARHGKLLRYECHEGHAFTGETLHSEQAEMIEAAMWSALRTLDENTELSLRLARNAANTGRHETARAFEEHARDSKQRADIIRKVLQRNIKSPRSA